MNGGKVSEELAKFKCPKFNELPEVELYMDQVLAFLDLRLAALKDGEDEHAATSTMINNYVKQRVIAPPVRKKYDRTHIAQLLFILMMKRVFSISEIKKLIGYFNASDNFPAMYDRFCGELDEMLNVVFVDSAEGIINYIQANNSGYGSFAVDDAVYDDEDKAELVIRSAVLAFTCKLYAQFTLERYFIK